MAVCRLAGLTGLSETRQTMEPFRRLMILFLCLAIALTGRGPVTELAESGTGHDAGHVHSHHANADHQLAAHAHSHGVGQPEGSTLPGDDSCACGCGMGSCAALPADLLLQHPMLARIEIGELLPTLRSSLHVPLPMAPLLRPPIC